MINDSNNITLWHANPAELSAGRYPFLKIPLTIGHHNIRQGIVFTIERIHMRTCALLIGLLCLMATGANAANFQEESCDQIRALISARTGLPAIPDNNLLKKLARPECRFTAAEVYRAAYGDKPTPKSVGEPRTFRARHDHDGHDDDDD